MITKRDQEVINFIEKFKIARTSTIKEIFFNSDRVAYRRLAKLVKDKVLKRERDLTSLEYIYYINKPKQLKHKLLLTELYKHFYNNTEIIKFETEYIIDDIRADAFICYKHKNRGYIAFIEIEISNKGFDTMKYKKLYLTGKYRRYFDETFPLIYLVTNQNIKDVRDIKIITISEDFSNIDNILRA